MVKNPPTNLVQEESYMPWDWACVLQLLKPSYLAPKQEKSLQWEACTSQLEKCSANDNPVQPKLNRKQRTSVI